MKELVFHYCSLETFFAIITNKTLRLSDVAKSNDNLEVLWTKKILLEMIEKESMSYECFNEYIKEKVPLDIYQAKLKEKAESFFKEAELKSKFFAICFSGAESEDKLSQWRGYGDDGQGIAIGFNKAVLDKTKKRMEFHDQDKYQIEFRKVEYKIEKQKDILRKFWAEQIYIANKQIKQIEVDFECWIVQCFYRLYRNAIFMKSPFFEEEDESRIVLEKERVDLEIEDEKLSNRMLIRNGQMFIRNGNIVEYYDLDISMLADDLIKKVVLGPKCKVEKEDIQLLLNRARFTNVEVVWSKGSYR